MPASSYIFTNAGLDPFGSGGAQLIEDSGVISDLEGGFDTASVTVLASGNIGFSLGDPHPDYPNMFLFGISPRRLPGGHRQLTLSYKGLAARQLGVGGDIPSEGGTVGKFTYGIKMIEKTWGKGELSGTVDGINLATVVVNVQQPQKTVQVSWVASAPFSQGIFTVPASGKTLINFTGIGAIDETFYISIANAAYNFPHGWVPSAANAEQVTPEKKIFFNSVSFTGIPRLSPG